MGFPFSSSYWWAKKTTDLNVPGPAASWVFIDEHPDSIDDTVLYMVEPTVEYGYRDLGIIQDCRRQYLEPGFALRTNDLLLATQCYQLRRQAATNAVLGAELDGVFTNIVQGDLAAARRRLAGLETNAVSVVTSPAR